MGRCADCGAWNSLVEERVSETPEPAAQGHRYTLPGTSGGATLYADVEATAAARMPTHEEFLARYCPANAA